MDANIQIRMPKEMKDEFYRITQQNAQNPSQLIRTWISRYIAENKKKELDEMLKEVDVRVTSEWLQKNIEDLYDAILDKAEEFASSDANTFTQEEYEDMKNNGFEANITISDYGTHWDLIVYVNDDTSAWIHEEAINYTEEELKKIIKLAEEEN